MDHTVAQRLVRRLADAVINASKALHEVTQGHDSALDEHQIACFDLAWALGDVRAAEASLGAISELDRELGWLFLYQRGRGTIDRLDDINRALGLGLAEIRSEQDWQTLATWATPKTIAALGRRSLAASDIGEPRLSDDAAMARSTFGRLADQVVAPLAAQIHRHDLTVPDEILTPMRELGAFGLAIPERYGGSAADHSEDSSIMIAVTEVLSEASLGAAGSLITRPEILARALLAGGTDAQKAEWLPRIASGDVLCAIAITEPDHGSDVAGLRLSATKVDGGWRLTGPKTWCTFAGRAELLMVVARTDPDHSLGHRGLSLMMVQKPADLGHKFHHERDDGTLSGKAIPTIGYRGMHSFDLSFDNWFVPDNLVIGEENGIGRGFHLTMAGMTGGRMQTAARACGVMQAGYKAVRTHTLARKVFAQPLAEYPLTLSKIASMAAKIAACRALTYQVAANDVSEDRAVQASVAKLVCCRMAEEVTREALQLHGGLGYAEESAVSRLFVDARVLSIFEGAEETLALKVIARAAIRSAGAL